MRVMLLFRAGAALALALMESAPEQPTTFLTGCACTMFLSAARSLLRLGLTDTSFKEELESLGGLLGQADTANPWLCTLRELFELLKG